MNISVETKEELNHLLWVYGDPDSRPEDFIDGSSQHTLTVRDAEKMADAILDLLEVCSEVSCTCGWGGEHNSANVYCERNLLLSARRRNRQDASEHARDTEIKSLASELHDANIQQQKTCDHGTYQGGKSHGQVYAMCQVHAEIIVSKRLARPNIETIEI